MMLLVQIICLFGAAFGFGYLARFCRLPALLGMIVGGFLVGNYLFPFLPYSGPVSFGQISSPVRMAVLAVVLLRAGLGISLPDLKKTGALAAGFGVFPMFGDAIAVGLGGYFLLNLPVLAAAALGFLVAAISPAIVIPGMIDLVKKRKGADRNVPTALMAGAPLDNIVALVGLGIALDLATSSQPSWGWALLSVPYSIFVGGLIGIAAGSICTLFLKYLPKPIYITLVLWIVACAIIPLCIAINASYVIAIIALGATVRARAPEQLPLLPEGLTKLWNVVQYALFGFIGAAFDLGPLAQIGVAAVLVILIGQLGRAVIAWFVGTAARLPKKERVACILCYLPKATIQAAFAGVALDRGLAQGQVLLSVAVLAIVMMAPIGVVALHHGADRLLRGFKKTKDNE